MVSRKLKKKKRFDWCKKLLGRYADDDLEKISFFDEKLFSPQESLESKNVRIYALAIENISEEMRSQEGLQNENKQMIWELMS